MRCLISAAEQRLADSASYWAHAHKSYFDPDEFRRNIQAGIQAFRSTTWMLQKERASIPNFEAWYSEKQEAMRADRRLRWLISARNQIEKQGDLNTKSKISVEYVGSNIQSEKRVINLPPNTRPKNVAKFIASAFPKSSHTDGAVLKISREWIDSELPEEEILSLLIYVYSFLRNLLMETHQLLNNEQRDACDFYRNSIKSNARLPKEMTRFEFPAVAWFSLQQGVLKEYKHTTKVLSERTINNIVKHHYNDLSALEAPLDFNSSFSEFCDKQFAIGKEMLQKDGFHTTVALIISNNDFNIIEFRPDDRADKHVMMHELASSCARHRAISCVFISECWIAESSPQYGPYAVNYPNRKEALSLDAFHKDEGFQRRLAIYERDGSRIFFSAQENNPASTFRADSFHPVVEAINRTWST